MSTFSKARLGRLHDVMTAHVERGAVPGLITVVSRRGEVHVDAVGAMHRDSDVPMATDTVFRIASVSKPITAVLAMSLIEECALRLDDAVDPWLPELAGMRVLRDPNGPFDDTVPAARPITVRDLLTFQLGAGLFIFDEGAPMAEAIDAAGFAPGPPLPSLAHPADEFLKVLGSLPLLFQPGERWLYNTGLDVLSALIPRATGRSLGELLGERIFGPLGMIDSGFVLPDSEASRLPSAYWPDVEWAPPDRVFDPAEGSEWLAPPPFESGAGGLLSTAADLLAFGEMLLSGGRRGGDRVLARASVEAMTSDQLSPAVKAVSGLGPAFFDAFGWGLGMAVVTRRTGIDRNPGSFGWDGGFGTSFWVDPAEELIGIQLTQGLWSEPVPPPVCADFWTGVYAAIED